MMHFFKRVIKAKVLSFMILFLAVVFNLNVHAGNDKLLTMAFVGDLGAGKSALRNVIAGEEFDFSDRNRTLQFDYVTNILDLGNNRHLFCRIWDTPGENKMYKQVIDKRVKSSNFVTIVYDLSTNVTEKNGQHYKDQFQLYATAWLNAVRENNPNCIITLLGNKMDIATRGQLEKAQKKFKAFQDLYDIEYAFVSAKRNEGLDGFFDMVKRTTIETGLLPRLPTWSDKGTEAIDKPCNLI